MAPTPPYERYTVPRTLPPLYRKPAQDGDRYADAYKAAIEIVGGEQYILSAVMHADERHRAMSEALGEDIFHYHLHVVYIPVVEKQILWSKR